jgi:hypothetical protein
MLAATKIPTVKKRLHISKKSNRSQLEQMSPPPTLPPPGDRPPPAGAPAFPLRILRRPPPNSPLATSPALSTREKRKRSSWAPAREEAFFLGTPPPPLARGRPHFDAADFVPDSPDPRPSPVDPPPTFAEVVRRRPFAPQRPRRTPCDPQRLPATGEHIQAADPLGATGARHGFAVRGLRLGGTALLHDAGSIHRATVPPPLRDTTLCRRRGGRQRGDTGPEVPAPTACRVDETDDATRHLSAMKAWRTTHGEGG